MPVLLAALVLAAAPAPPPGREATILGYAQDGPVDYRIDGQRGIWVRAENGNWYYLHIQGPCPRLAPQSAFSVETGPQGQLDRYSVIHVEGDRCLLSSVTTSAPPPGYGKHRH
ncbi:MAG TPA: hypothetical protein VFL92_10225 [Sphingomonas sp.]|nr:hypothetical protein [Sphingomonas sp.]